MKSFVVRNRKFCSLKRLLFIKNLNNKGIVVNYIFRYDILYFFNFYIKNTLEVGFGNEISFLKIVNCKYRSFYIGVEFYVNGFSKVINFVCFNKIICLFIFYINVYTLFKYNLQFKFFNEIRFFFPDPWIKSKYKKKRILNFNFVSLLYRTLHFNGFIFVVTDCINYIKYIFFIFSKCHNFKLIYFGHFFGFNVFSSKFLRRAKNISYDSFCLVFIKI